MRGESRTPGSRPRRGVGAPGDASPGDAIPARRESLQRHLVATVEALGRAELGKADDRAERLRALQDADAASAFVRTQTLAAFRALFVRATRSRAFEFPETTDLAEAGGPDFHDPSPGVCDPSPDFRDLSAEDLGAVYQALLDMEPRVDAGQETFRLVATEAGERALTARRRQGSFYTPPELVDRVLDVALDPLLDEVTPRGADALLALRVCDPACGSGYFLLAAAHRLARRVAGAREGRHDPSASSLREALTDVVRNCVYGVDLDEVAVELCRFSLWLEARDPHLDPALVAQHVVCGNSLLGAGPSCTVDGISDTAFRGRDERYAALCATLRKRNRQERQEMGRAGAQLELFAPGVPSASSAPSAPSDPSAPSAALFAWDAAGATAPVCAPDAARYVADAWCAAFAWPLDDALLPPLTERGFQAIVRDGRGPNASIEREVARLAHKHRFLHWHLAFPELFGARPALRADVPAPDEALRGTLAQVGDAARVDSADVPATVPAEARVGQRSSGFHVIVGNPPYLRDSRKKDVPQNLLEHLHACAVSHYDLCILFIERSLSLLAPQGRLALLTSNGWLRQKYGRGICALLADRALTDVIEVDYNAFDAGVRTCIVGVRNARAETSASVAVLRACAPAELNGRGRAVPLSRFREVSTFAPEVLVAGEDGHEPVGFPEVLVSGRSMRADGSCLLRLEDVAFVSLGMVFHDPRPGGRRKYDYLRDRCGEPFVTALLDGENVERWRTKGCWWLDWCPDEHREPRFREMFECSAKVLCRRIVGRADLMAYVDEDGRFFSDNVVGAIPWHSLVNCDARIVRRRIDEERIALSREFDPWFVVALVNSAFASRYFRTVLGGHWHFYPAHARGLPIPRVGDGDVRALAEIARTMQRLASEGAPRIGERCASEGGIAEQVAVDDEGTVGAVLSDLQAHLDARVEMLYRLCGLTCGDIAGS